MKKLLLMFSVMLIFVVVRGQQTITITNYADTLVDAETHYYNIGTAGLVKNTWYYTIQANVDHITGSTDSTQISYQASVDGTTWFDILVGTSGTYTVTVTPTQATNQSAAGLYTATFKTSDDQFLWHPTEPLAFKYMRMKVQHYATGTVRIKAWVYIKSL